MTVVCSQVRDNSKSTFQVATTTVSPCEHGVGGGGGGGSEGGGRKRGREKERGGKGRKMEREGRGRIRLVISRCLEVFNES